MFFVEDLIDNKQKILNIALDLFSEKGFDSVGVQLLAEKSGITKPTLYYYFGNKEGVFKELLKGYYENLNSLLLKINYIPKVESYHEDVFPVLVKVVQAYFNFAMHNEKFYRMVLCALFSPPTSKTNEIVKDLHNTQYEIINKMFIEIAKAHPNMKGREKRLCWTFIGMVNTYIWLWYNKAEELSKTTAEDAVKQFMHGIYT